MRNFIIFTLVLFFLAALLRIDFFFTIFYLFIGVYVVSRIWTRQSLRRLVVYRTLPERAFLSERLTVTIHFTNGSRLPVPWLMVTESFSSVLSSPPFFRRVISLGSHSQTDLQYELVARRRGYYQIGPTRVETGDLLGINRSTSGLVDANHLIVYPKIVPIVQLKLPTHSPQVVLPTSIPLFKDPNRLIGVTGYLPGDNPRHIHWPATASQGQVMVKKFETAIARDNAIFINLNRTAYGRPGQAGVAIELAIVTAASLANHMINREELPVGLFATGFDPLSGQMQRFRLSPNKGRNHLMQILEVLARIESQDEDQDFPRQIQHEALHRSWGTTITVITCTESELLLQTLLMLKRSGFQLALVLVQPAAYVYPPTRWAEGTGIPVYRITREKDIERCLPSV
jgi:uncharacterized protein (DUF58 family)